MMDIVVTTPKSEIENSAREASECLADGGGYYCRKIPATLAGSREFDAGSKVFYAENGYVRGYGVVQHIWTGAYLRELANGDWRDGFYAAMPAESWTWIEPIPMRGFQGYRRMFTDRVRVVG